MNCVDFKKLVASGLIIGIVAFFAIAGIQHIEIGPNFDTLSAIGTSAGFIWILWVIFEKYLWRVSLLKGWLVLVPDLNGEWNGEILWNDEKKDIEATIKQTLTKVTIDMKTDEMVSKSLSADLCPDLHRGICEINYSYQSVPSAKVRSRSPIHFGAAQLNTSKDTLQGNYWTDRKSTGTLKLNRFTK